ncbi:hypothetical protein BGY98DRAFT_940469, partial [Russula aff. rugulosa BPL654]
KIAPGVPNLPPKGQLNGSTINVTYGSVNDPACSRVDRPLVYDTEAPRTTPRRGQLPEPSSMGYAFDDGPNYTHITISRPRSRKRQRSTSEVVFSTGRLRRSALMRTAINSSCFCTVAMIEHDLMSQSPVTAFQSQDAFAELWYSIKVLRPVTVVTPTCSRPPYGDVDLFEYRDINLTFSVVIRTAFAILQISWAADYRLEV